MAHSAPRGLHRSFTTHLLRGEADKVRAVRVQAKLAADLRELVSEHPPPHVEPRPEVRAAQEPAVELAPVDPPQQLWGLSPLKHLQEGRLAERLHGELLVGPEADAVPIRSQIVRPGQSFWAKYFELF